jgi:hypothetical protein
LGRDAGTGQVGLPVEKRVGWEEVVLVALSLAARPGEQIPWVWEVLIQAMETVAVPLMKTLEAVWSSASLGMKTALDLKKSF